MKFLGAEIKNPEEVRAVASGIIDCLDKKPGFSVTGQNIFRYEYNESRLAHLLELEKGLERYYASGSKGITVQAITSLHPTDRTVDNFLKAIENQVQAVKQKPKRTFTLIFPMNMEFPFGSKRAKKIRIGDVSLSWIPVNIFIEKYKEKIPRNDLRFLEWRYKNPKNLMKLYRCSFIGVNWKARDKAFAVEKARYYINLLVGVICFIKLFGKYRWSTHPGRLSAISQPSDVIVFDSQGRFVDIGEFGSPPESVDRFKYNELTRYAEYWKSVASLRERNNLKSLLLDGLVMYGSATTEPIVAFAFLKFWIGLENLTLRPKKDEVVIRRIKNVMKMRFEFFDSMLKSCLDKRNLMVHEGLFSTISQEDINFIRMVYEGMISTVHRQAKLGRTTEEIELIFQLGIRDRGKLLAARRVSDYLVRRTSK